MAAPSSTVAQLRKAWQAGVRPSSAWWTVGLSCVAWAAVCRVGFDVAPGIADQVGAALRGDAVAARTLLVTTVSQAAVLLLALAAAAVAIAALAAAIASRLGPIRPAMASGLALAPRPHRVTLGFGVTAGLLALGVVALRGRIAGAARAADASDAALVQLWRGSVVEVLLVIGVLAIACGVIELWLGRRDLRLAIERGLSPSDRPRGGTARP
ncbi:MAG: hypothetical protein K1X88_06650 [Nannocystaceae bacterium]|nr:hypothetical protein [Nannocystaceae bacterium]